jgi:hypothetical protein
VRPLIEFPTFTEVSRRPASDRQRHAGRPGRLGEQAGEAKHPPVDGDMVDLDAALSEQFLDVSVDNP